MLTQLDIYTEEKFEDEEDLRERSLANHRRTVSDSEVIVHETLDIARQYDELYPMVVSSVSHIREILEKEDAAYVVYPITIEISETGHRELKAHIIYVIAKFIEQATSIDDLYESVVIEFTGCLILTHPR